MPKNHDDRAKSPPLDPRLSDLEALVDELVKDAPREEKVRACMKAAGLDYTADPIARMTSVLEALDDIRVQQRAMETEI